MIAVEYIFRGEVLTSKAHHVGEVAEREILLAFFQATVSLRLAHSAELLYRSCSVMLRVGGVLSQQKSSESSGGSQCRCGA